MKHYLQRGVNEQHNLTTFYAIHRGAKEIFIQSQRKKDNTSNKAAILLLSTNNPNEIVRRRVVASTNLMINPIILRSNKLNYLILK